MHSDASELQRLAGEMLQEVLRRTHLSSAPDLATVVAEEGRRIGVDPLVLYILDHEQRVLVPVPRPGADDRQPLPLGGTVAGGRTRRTQSSSSTAAATASACGCRCWTAPSA